MAPKAGQTTESYEEIRQRNIAANRSLLLSLQLAVPGGFGPSLVPKPVGPKAAVTGETKREPTGGTKERRKKAARREPADAEEQEQQAPGGRRRSGRILQQLQQRTASKRTSRVAGEDDDGDSEDADEYEAGADDDGHSDDSEAKENGTRKRKSTWRPPTEPKRPRGSLPPQRKTQCLKGNRPNPKIFGQQIGTEVGDWWNSRMDCSQAGVHAPPVCGIAGSDGVGCWSVALSGGYEDDVDLGYAFTFTGSGGRALSGTAEKPKNLRTAPQSSDQEFTAMNASLRLSCDLKNSVRVIRGYKNHSPFAPDEGYRYDGLYRVEKCWREAGQSGFQVCKFAFVRLPNQPRIPIKEGREAEAEQILRDMGIATEALPGTAAESRLWTQTLAKQRILAQRAQTAVEPANTPETGKPTASPSPENTQDGSNEQPAKPSEDRSEPPSAENTRDEPDQPVPVSVATIA
ncbi:hypothetical protein PtA15_3A146 [Puccinia triticina]|nr:uncharacterized protein PtA15_3A146 [Puccinia triticina]WAQ82782.1 hypothetical protein PtA15_3A146 [Puccinia triticina]